MQLTHAEKLDLNPPLLAIHLFHGRKTPYENLDDWGFQGPVIGPFHWCHTTYDCDTRLGREGMEHDEEGLWELRKSICGDVLYYDGNYYGDWSVAPFALFEADGCSKMEPFDAEKAKLPENIPEDPDPDVIAVDNRLATLKRIAEVRLRALERLLEPFRPADNLYTIQHTILDIRDILQHINWEPSTPQPRSTSNPENPYAQS